MGVIRWAAVAVTSLIGLMNLGTVISVTASNNLKVIGAAFGVAGIAAAVGLAIKARWGRNAVVGIGVVNVIAAIIALTNDIPEGWLGLALSAVATTLGLATRHDT